MGNGRKRLDGNPTGSVHPWWTECLPSLSPQQLAGRRFTFPSNPAPGYIDGSIYIEHAHHPFDVNAIAFVASADGGLTARILGVLMLEVEGLQCVDDGNEEFANTRLELETRVSFERDV